MALTEYEVHLFFECIDIPNSTDVLVIDGAFGTGKTTATGAILVTRAEIITRMAALPTALITRLQELLAEWVVVSTSNVVIKANTANEGVDLDPKKKRELIRQRVKKIVPVVIKERDNQGSAIRSQTVVIGTIEPAAVAHTAGGYALNPAKFGLTTVNFVDFEPCELAATTALIPRYDRASDKFTLHQGDGPATAGPLAESDEDTIAAEPIRFIAYGRA